MSAPSHWTFGESTLRRIVEYEGPILSPFEIFGDCTQAHLDQNRAWLVPRFQDATSGILIITIQSFLIRRDGLTVLVDACGGNDKERARPHFHRRSWPWLETLRYAGVAPKDIDVVLSAICPAVWPTGVSKFAQIPLGRCAYNSSSPKPEGRPNENPPHVQA